MKPAILNVTILAALAMAATALFLVSPSSPASSLASSAEPQHEPPISVKTGAADVPETGRLPVPIVRRPNEPAQMPPAAAPAQGPVAESSSPPAYPPPVLDAPLPRGSSPDVDDTPAAEQRLQAALATLPRGPDIRYWIVPLNDGGVMVVARRQGEPGPDGWDNNRKEKHRRRGWN